MASEHTPGPWKKAERLNGPWWHISSEHTVGGEKCKSGRQAIATVHGESKKGSPAYAEMFEANARLIATAPELLEALLTARDHIDMGALEISHWKDAAQIRAAIAKATGATHD